MSKWRKLLVALFCAFLVLSPALAEARAGGSARPGGSMGYSSQGSMGSRTYNYNGGAPINRSITPQGTPYSSPSYGYGYGSFAANHPFLTGLAGGFFGSWIGSMLFPHWGYGYGAGYGGAGVIGSLLSWVLIIGAIWFIFRAVRSRGYFMSGIGGGGGAAYYEGPSYGRAGAYGGGYGGGGAATRPIAVNETDYAAFEAILKAVQGAWSNGDLRTLSHYCTPEMLSYFSEQLAGNTSQGVVNRCENIELIHGDVREAWDEGNLQYATVHLRWRAVDYTVRSDREPTQPGWLVEGDPHTPSEVQEMWTFARSPGGHWLLSAIQQV